jgi:hypothetical protein
VDRQIARTVRLMGVAVGVYYSLVLRKTQSKMPEYQSRADMTAEGRYLAVGFEVLLQVRPRPPHRLSARPPLPHRIPLEFPVDPRDGRGNLPQSRCHYHPGLAHVPGSSKMVAYLTSPLVIALVGLLARSSNGR